MSDVTRILSNIERGDPTAADQLLPLVYGELRKLAASKLAQEKPGLTLQATALVHEAYVRLVGVDQTKAWQGRGHFFSAAAEAMRRILIEQARRKSSQKGGGGLRRQDVDVGDLQVGDATIDLLDLDDALERLGREHERAAALVKLRFFAGLSTVQAARVLGISTSTADNDWVYAKSWLLVALDEN